VVVVELWVEQEHQIQSQDQMFHTLAEVVVDQIIDVHLVELVEQVVVEQVDLDQEVLVQDQVQMVQLIQVVEQVEMDHVNQDKEMVVQES
tara:strand:- start:59 stop:328 length:270 start_codon:yes stop_codon:yes gene_type:complete